MNRIDFTPEYLDQVLRLLRRPQSMLEKARQLGVSNTTIKRNLRVAGLWAEFENRDHNLFRGVPPPVPKGWCEGIANKYLVMKLRAQA